MSTETYPDLKPGDHLRFDDKSTSWLVRAVSDDQRYALATASFFGAVHYTILDRERGVRGPLNVIGGGMGIHTTNGLDDQIDETMRMLRPSRPLEPGESRPVDADDLRGFEVSHRNNVPIHITRHLDEATR